MSRRQPETPGELWDLAHEMFGISEWVEVPGGGPFWEYRRTEVAKVKRSLASRQIKVEHVALALHYCRAEHIDIRNVVWAYKHILDAIRWDKARRASEAGRALQERLDAALAACIAAGDQESLEWHSRLTRADESVREEVLAAWETQQVRA